jgi:2-hydroxy-6-oxonona-2,4-dienedioate hydrolase
MKRCECRTQIDDFTIFSRERIDLSSPLSSSLVLVHGYAASSRYMVPLLNHLAAHCRVYAPDLPGWGKSSKPAHTLGISDLADVLAGWVLARGLQRPVFLGNSLGCQILVELAVRHPDLSSGLILLGPTVDPRARSVRRQALRLAVDIPLERPSLWPIEIWDWLHMGLPHAVGIVRVMIDDRIEEKLPWITVPVLVVRGSRDPIVPQAWAEEACRLLPDGSLVVLPGAGHAANYSAPERLTAAILPFVEEWTARSSARAPIPGSPSPPER